MMNQEQQQALALAATVQALSIVNEVATSGQFDAERAEPVLYALTTYNPDDTLSAYGGDTSKLRFGMKQAKKLLSDDINRDIAQYLLSVLSIELKLVRNTEMRQQLQSQLQRIASHISNTRPVLGDDDLLDDGSEMRVVQFTDTEILSEFAELYKQTASQTEPRIMIKGNQQYLQQESSANQIRALLLAALRGAAFFRHNGGKRLDLMMRRNQFVDMLGRL